MTLRFGHTGSATDNGATTATTKEGPIQSADAVIEVVRWFRTLGELGYTDILVRHLTNDQPKVLGSLERLETVRAALG